MHEAGSVHRDVTTNNAEPPVYATVQSEDDTADGIANGSLPNGDHDYAYASYTPSSQQQAVKPLSAPRRGGGGAMAGNQKEMTTTTNPAASDEYAEPYGQIITQGAGAEYAYAYVSGESFAANEEHIGCGGNGSGPQPQQQEEGWEQNIIYATAAGTTDGESMGGHDGGGVNSAATTEEGWADNSIYNSGDDDEGGDNAAKIEEGWENNIIYEQGKEAQ